MYFIGGGFMQQDIRFNLLHQFGVFYHQSHQYMKKSLKDLKISSIEQPIVLFLISKYQPLLQKELAQLLNVQPATVSVHLKHLEKEGYICRKTGQKDKRELYVSLTENGQNLLEEAYQKVLILSHEITDSLSEEEVRQLQMLITKMLMKIKEEGGDTDA